MASTRLLPKFFTPMIAVAMVLAVVGSADAEVVALRSGTGGAYGLFQSNSELSPVFTDALPGKPIDATTPGTGGNGNITIIDNTVDDNVLFGSADTDSTGIAAGGSNSFDESIEFWNNGGATSASRLSASGVGQMMSLLKFDVSQANNLIGGTIAKAELRLFFDGGAGPGDLFGFRDFDDKVGRITTFDWAEGNKDNLPPGLEVTDPNTGAILIPGAPGASRGHPISSNPRWFQDINNNVPQRSQGFWFDSGGVVDNSDPNQPLYRTFLGSDYDVSGVVNGDDLARWEANYGSTTPPPTGFNWKFPFGDDDLNGVVDGEDFLTWQRNAGKIGVDIFGDPNAEVRSSDFRGWFGSDNPGGDTQFQAPTWGDGNDYFNPDPVDYTTNPTDFPLLAVDGVEFYRPIQTAAGGGTSARFPVSPIDGVSPGDGDVATETNSEDSSSLGFLNNFDYSSGFSENDPNGDVGTQAGFDVWDITTIVQAWADGANNFGLYVRDNLRTFAMSETPHGLDFAPVLFIDYTPAGAVAAVPEPSSIVLLGLASLAGLARRRRIPLVGH